MAEALGHLAGGPAAARVPWTTAADFLVARERGSAGDPRFRARWVDSADAPSVGGWKALIPTSGWSGWAGQGLGPARSASTRIAEDLDPCRRCGRRAFRMGTGNRLIGCGTSPAWRGARCRTPFASARARSDRPRSPSSSALRAERAGALRPTPRPSRSCAGDAVELCLVAARRAGPWRDSANASTAPTPVLELVRTYALIGHRREIRVWKPAPRCSRLRSWCWSSA